ncbi:hypothetical protein IQ247_06950 [Plectonema cf. radiosum LEGE 06105]|uniref:Uncharacterized protein n=1 Tax=Plectonema cf. radiosum LEGE 06105 TaxID=945769 RepID=A0A8J7EYI2_9CYAN|nr:hypothetical protein [Plectonema cf. radiosum LEGE 06105]
MGLADTLSIGNIAKETETPNINRANVLGENRIITIL